MYVCVEDGGWGEVRLKLDVQGQASGRILNADGQGIGGLENGTIFMDGRHMCVIPYWKDDNVPNIKKKIDELANMIDFGDSPHSF